MGPDGTSVMVRAYNQTPSGLASVDVTSDSMNGFGNLAVKEVRPRVSNPVAPPSQATYVLLSGYMTGTNGPLNRMRLYAYDGSKLRPLWMPEDIWGTFDVDVSSDGFFTVDGDYYRESRERHDRYVLTEDYVALSVR